MGKLTSFPRSVKRKPNETVFFSFIVYKSRAHRDRVMAKVMKDKRIADMMNIKDMPFDAKRMILAASRCWSTLERRTAARRGSASPPGDGHEMAGEGP